MDISEFMQWFISQVVSMFSYFYNLLDSIQFLGTSLLKVTITITILVPLLTVLLTITHNASVSATRSTKVKGKESKDEEE